MVDNPADPQFENDRIGSGCSVETHVIGFHTHSSASDGTISPGDLIARAAREGVQHFALTDHDTINGYLAVKDRVLPGLKLVSGVELSCQWARMGVHIVGLGFDQMLQTFCGISENWTPRVWIERGASLNALPIQECRGAGRCAVSCPRRANWPTTFCPLDGNGGTC